MSRVPLTGDVGFARDLGSGITFPTQGPSASALRRGDAYYHSTYGALFQWNGTAWRARGPGELTAAQRAALVTANIPYAGFQVFETDTKLTWQWDGASWTSPAVPMSGFYFVNQTGVPSAALWGCGTPTKVRESGGLNATLVTDNITVPAGIWDLDWSIILSGVTLNGGRSFLEVRPTASQTDGYTRVRKGQVGGSGDDFFGMHAQLQLPGTAPVSLNFVLFLTTGVTFNAQHYIRMTRLGTLV